MGQNKKGEIIRTAEHLINEDGKIVKSDVTGKWSHTFLYHYKGGLKTSVVKVYKKSTTVHEYIYTFY